MLNIQKTIEENKRRNEQLFAPYDPIKGIGSLLDRFKLQLDDKEDNYWMLPMSMEKDIVIAEIVKSELSVKEFLAKRINDSSEKTFKRFIQELIDIRFDHDFEFWAYSSYVIQDKETFKEFPLKCRYGQRKMVKQFEKRRLADIPIKANLLKSRQFGGTTLVQAYFFWIQQRHKKNWHSAVIAQDDNAAKYIRGMYELASESYPEELGSVTLAPYKNSTKNKICVERGCVIGVGSVENPKQFRAYNRAMVHASEVGFWGETSVKNAAKLAAAVKSSIADVPYSACIQESTAKGVGNYFHGECMASLEKKSDFDLIFVPFFEIELYRRKIDDYEQFIKDMDSMTVNGEKYALGLWNKGATLEAINWYFWYKKANNYADEDMFEEYPSDPMEAFVSSGRRAIPIAYVLNLRKTCVPPSYIGEIYGDAHVGAKSLNNVRIEKDPKGLFYVWIEPDKSIAISNRYLVVVDVGGRWDGADDTVIKVFDRYGLMEGGKMEVVAVWAGHGDQDIIAWKSAQIAKLYNNALLVVERNKLAAKDDEEVEVEGDHSLTVLNAIAEYYDNLYARNLPDVIKEGVPPKWGFFTDKSTKPMIVDALIAAGRDESYIERDERACDQMDYFQRKYKRGHTVYEATDGKKDDHVDTTGIGIHISETFMDPPKLIKRDNRGGGRKIVSEATI